MSIISEYVSKKCQRTLRLVNFHARLMSFSRKIWWTAANQEIESVLLAYIKYESTNIQAVLHFVHARHTGDSHPKQ